MINKVKKAFLILCGFIVMATSIPTYAYTESEKEAAKSWLSAHGYSPTMAGAQQAYQDYLNGKFNDICEQYGLPKQGVSSDSSSSSNSSSGSRSSSGGSSASSGSNNSQESDDYRFHFSESRKIKNQVTVTLLEILVDKQLAPLINNKANTQTAEHISDNDMVYADMIFKVKNTGKEELDAKTVLDISLKCENDKSYKESTILLEKEDKTGWKEDTIIQPGKTGILHYAIQASDKAEHFTGTVTFHKEEYQLLFNRETHPANREELQAGEEKNIKDFGQLTVGEATESTSEKDAFTLTVPLKITNSSKEEKDIFALCDGIAYYNGNISRGNLNVNGQTWNQDSENLAVGETVEAELTIPLDEQVDKKKVQIILFLDGEEYSLKY